MSTSLSSRQSGTICCRPKPNSIDPRTATLIREKEYQPRGIADSFATLYRQLTRYREWATLAFLAEMKAPMDGGRVAAIGIKVARTIIATSGNQRVGVADAHMRDLASGRPDLDLTALEMLQQIYWPGDKSMAPLRKWAPYCSSPVITKCLFGSGSLFLTAGTMVNIAY